MKYCSQCGAQLPDEALFCDSCGTRQQAARQSTTSQQTMRQSNTRRQVEPEPQPKKTLGQKMMDNYRTNRAMQKERLKNIKWWHWVIIAVALAYFMGA